MAGAERAAGAHWGELFVAPGAEMPFVNLFVPVRLDGRFAGTLIAGVSTEELSRFLATLGGDRTANAFILYGHDAVLAHPRLRDGFPGLSDAHPLPSLEELDDPVLERIWAPDRFPAHGVGVTDDPEMRVVEAGGKKFLLLFRELTGYSERPWIVGTYEPLDRALPQLRRLEHLLWIGLLVLLLALSLALLLGRGLGRPIRQLAAAATRVRELDFDAPPAQLHGPFRELNEAAAAYDAMVGELRLFAAYVPRALVRRLVLQRPRGGIAPEEREVTVLFTDIAGFTAFAERLPASEVAGFLNRHFTLVDRCVEAWEGTLDKYIGDSVMAFWGAPGDQPDHALRACRAALAIAAAVGADNEERSGRGHSPVRIHVGVHSGRALVGNIGAPSRVNYTVIGDVANVAERLEELARVVAGDEDKCACILVGGATARQLGAGFDLVPLGRRALRGRAEPLEAFRLRA